MTRLARSYSGTAVITLLLVAAALIFHFPALFLAAAVAGGFLRIYDQFFPRVLRLAAVSRVYHGGDASVRIPVAGRDEISSLQHGFNEMADEIEAMRRQAERLAATRSEFVSTVSHELRSPLTAVSGYVKMMLSGDAGELNETQREFLGIVDVNCTRLDHLISDLLDADKMESGKVQLVRKEFDLAPVLEEVRATFAALAAQKGLQITLNSPASLGPMLGDRNRLTQVFVNLVSNAVKYTQQGRIEISAEQGEQAVVIMVKDSGIGLTEAEQEKLFQRFYRARSGLTSGEPGSGLGLFIAYRLVIAHGGAIGVESEPGRGATFTVTLPLASGAPRALEAAAGVDPQQPGLPVWLLERDEGDAARIASIIKRSGIRVRGRHLDVVRFESVEALPEESPGATAPVLLIYDPQSQAYEASLPAQLRRKLPAGVPILVISPSVATAGAFSEAASALLTKPIDEREFIIALHELLAAKERRVLLVSSATDIRGLLRLELERRGIKADDVSSGQTGLARLEAGGFGLLLVDEADLTPALGIAELSAYVPVVVLLREAADPARLAAIAEAGATLTLERQKGLAEVAEAVYRFLEGVGG